MIRLPSTVTLTDPLLLYTTICRAGANRVTTLIFLRWPAASTVHVGRARRFIDGAGMSVNSAAGGAAGEIAGAGPSSAWPARALRLWLAATLRSEEHTSELPSLMRISYAVFWLKKTHTTQLH